MTASPVRQARPSLKVDSTLPNPDRYSRQARFAGLGAEGQSRIQAGRVVVVGCGALGSVAANGLVRAGVGFVRVVDRDFIELNNLQRQFLYCERDVADNLPKAEAAARALRAINSEIVIEGIVADLDRGNIAALCGDVDVIVDGTDNFEIRYLLNDFAAFSGKPWIFAGCIGSEAQTLTILPGRTPCLRCLMPSAPNAGDAPTCETAGILGPASAIVANFQVAETLKILSGHCEAVNPGFVVFDVWDNTFRRLRLDGIKAGNSCPVCDEQRYDWLHGQEGAQPTRLCGRNAVQISPPRKATIDLAALASRLDEIGTTNLNRFLLKAIVEGYELTIFPDGRAIIKGTDDIAEARTLYNRFVGG